MSKLDELIAELCPNGVKYYTLNECFDQFSGMGGVTNKWADAGNCQFVDYMNAYNHIAVDVQDLPFATVKNLNQAVLRQGDVLFTSASETPDECAISSLIEDEIKDGIFLDDHLFGLRVKKQFSDNIFMSFLKYVFRTNNFRQQVKKAVRGVTRFYVSKHGFMNLVIPVPPLEVQREIVRVLDNFTFLTAELTAELTARRKQYDYYRNRLFIFDDETDNKILELGSIAKVTKLAGFEFTKYVQYSNEGKVIALRGLNVKDGRLVLNDVKYIDKSDFSKLERSKLRIDDMLFTYVGTVGQVALIDKNDKYYLAPNVALIRIENKNIIPKFLMYYFQTSIFKDNEINRLQQSSSMKNIPMGKIRRFKVPVPSIETQKRVISVLDNFDAVCNDISIGLPAEIAARQTQYEYYRDKLLSFKELNA